MRFGFLLSALSLVIAFGCGDEGARGGSGGSAGEGGAGGTAGAGGTGGNGGTADHIGISLTIDSVRPCEPGTRSDYVVRVLVEGTSQTPVFSGALEGCEGEIVAKTNTVRCPNDDSEIDYFVRVEPDSTPPVWGATFTGAINTCGSFGPPRSCFSDDECGVNEYCVGVGACDSEGTCAPFLSIPCPFVGDPRTGVWSEPVCGCDDTTYQSSCVAGSAGARIAYDEACEGGAFGNTLIRVDTLYPGAELARMDIDISCDVGAEPPDQAPPDTVHISGELELTTSGEGGGSVWEGVFDLPIGACTLTLRLSCDSEVVCIGSQTITVGEGDNFLDVILPCSTGPAVCDGMGQ